MKAFEKRLASVQASVGSALPVNYVSLLRQGVPEFSQPVGVPFRGELWDVIYLFELGCGHEDQQLDSTCALVSDVLPRYAVPIASDHAGNFFCLFVTGNEAGKVVWWDHERELDEDHTEFVAESLEDFIRLIRPFPPDDAQPAAQADGPASGGSAA